MLWCTHSSQMAFGRGPCSCCCGFGQVRREAALGGRDCSYHHTCPLPGGVTRKLLPMSLCFMGCMDLPKPQEASPQHEEEVFYVECGRALEQLPREVVVSPSSETFQRPLDVFLCHLPQVTLPWQGRWTW